MRTLIEEDRFSTLAAMIDTLLSGTTNRYPLLQMAPYTFFAPTDDAFERLFTALGTTRESFIRQDRSTLYRWLAGHEHARRLLSADVRLGYPVHVWGGVIKLEREGDTLVAYGQASSRARITTADIDDGTSIVHIVDGVLQWTFDDARSSLQKETGFSIAARVIGECDEQVSHDEWGEIWTLNAGTVLAPTDAAFAAYFEERGITEAQFFSLPAVERTDLFRYHLLLDQQLFAELVAGSPLTTKNGASFTVDASRVVTDRIGGTANIVRTDWLHYEGVIHAIDRVLRPG
jgi:uncharacterized surface protein with fasciclin (FAS1) repeats